MQEYDAFTGAPTGSKDACLPTFFYKQFKVDTEEGHSFEPREYVRILTPMSRDEVVRPVEDADRKRWPGHYEAFKKGEEPPEVGYPLKEWSALTASEVEMLKAVGIKTVEQLAGMSENKLPQIPGILRMIGKARSFDVDAASGLRAENAELQSQVAALRERIAELEAPKQAPKTAKKATKKVN